MQISNAASSPTLTQPAQAGAVTGATPDATTSNGGKAAASAPPVGLSQDAAVNISPEGATALAEDPGGTTASSTTTQTGTTSNDTTADTDTADADNTDDTDSASQSSSVNDSGGDAGDTSSVSPLKSFAYGTLGLERPDQTQQETNSFYTAGRWLAAGITIGGLISLLA